MTGGWAHCGDCDARSEMLPSDTAVMLWVETHTCAPPKPKPTFWAYVWERLNATPFRLLVLLSSFTLWMEAEGFWWLVLAVTTSLSTMDIGERIDKPRRRR